MQGTRRGKLSPETAKNKFHQGNRGRKLVPFWEKVY